MVPVLFMPPSWPRSRSAWGTKSSSTVARPSGRPAALEVAPLHLRRPCCLSGAAPGRAITISYAAEILGEDVELLSDMVTDMEPEDGCLWIYNTADRQPVAF